MLVLALVDTVTHSPCVCVDKTKATCGQEFEVVFCEGQRGIVLPCAESLAGPSTATYKIHIKI